MSLILRGVDYGPVQSASGAQGWWGEGYWFHKWIPGLNWKGCTFVAKTTTFRPREGNMPFWGPGGVLNYENVYEPRGLFPKCIVVKPWEGLVLNAVGLSGPGAKSLFQTGHWQKLKRPFFLSFMSVADTQEQRYNEAQGFVEQLLFSLPYKAPFGLQINLSCPNTGHDPSAVSAEAKEILSVFQGLRVDAGIPIVPKFNVLYPVGALGEIQDLCDAVCISNTLPWGTLPADVDWSGLFDVPESADEPPSPLDHLGGGGLSGWPLLPLVEEWVKAARGRGIQIPINAGGGILKPSDVDVLARAGADSVFLGSIAILRGWRLHKTIKRAHKVLGSHGGSR